MDGKEFTTWQVRCLDQRPGVGLIGSVIRLLRSRSHNCPANLRRNRLTTEGRITTTIQSPATATAL